jgi:hypothetical protein
MESIFFYSLVVMVIVGFVMHNKFLNKLKEKYPNVWESLEKPSLLKNNSPKNNFAVQRYIFKKEYKALDDKNFISFCDSLRRFNIFYLCYFILCIFIVLNSLILKKL